MNYEYFIAKKVGFGEEQTFTKVIIRIAGIAIALSLAVMIITTALVTGFKKEITEKIFGFWGHIHVTNSNMNISNEPIPLDIDGDYYRELQRISSVEFQEEMKIGTYEIEGRYTDGETRGGIRQVHPYGMAPGIINTKNDFEGVMVKGLSNEFDWKTLKPYIIKGDTLTIKDSLISDEILISRKVAERLRLDVEDKVVMHFIRDGDQLKRRFIIKGIYNTGLAEYDKRFVIADLKQVQEVYHWTVNEVSGLEVFVEDMNDIDVLSEYIYYNELPPNVFSQTIKERFPNIFEWLALQDINELIILALMILVCVINMITALLILILERTKMVGVLKSLGCTNWSIRKIFIYQAGRIMFYGMLWGTGIGVLICLAQKYFGFIKLDEANYYLSVAPIDLNVSTVILLNLLTLVIVIVFMVLPSYLITRIDPIRALRFD